MNDWLNKKVESDKPKHEQPPAGTHPAVLIGLIDLGTQETDYKGQIKDQHQIMLVWELCNEVRAGGTSRHVISQVYNFSANPKSNLRQTLESWRGRKYAEGEDLGLDKALGRGCLVNISTSQGESGSYAKLAGVMPLPKGMQVGSPQRTPVARQVTSLDPLPDWVPYVYGEDPREVIDRARENRPKDSPRHTSAPADTAYPPTTNGQAGRQLTITSATDDAPF